MSQQYFSESEWATLLQTPKQAILAIVLADKTDLVTFMKEIQAAFQIMAAELKREDFSSDLVKSVVTSFNEMLKSDEDQWLQRQQFELLSAVQGMSSASDGQKQAIAHLDEIRVLLLNKVPVLQAEDYKQWILSIATQVAKAVKEGGSFKIGGAGISRPESDALDAIDKALQFKI